MEGRGLASGQAGRQAGRGGGQSRRGKHEEKSRGTENKQNSCGKRRRQREKCRLVRGLGVEVERGGQAAVLVGRWRGVGGRGGR